MDRLHHVYNSDVARMFNQIADLLAIEGANEYRVRAYRKAARTLTTMSRSVVDMVEDGEDLTALEGIGEDLAGKIREAVNTGGMEQLETIQRRTPPALSHLLDIAGLGPKRVQTIYQELNVTNLEELQEAAERGQIRDLHGLGEKTEQKILEALEQRNEEEQRTRLDVAEAMTEPLLAYLRGLEGVEQAEVAGSYRRRKETVGDLDILAISEAGQEVIAQFAAYGDVEEVISEGETRSTVIIHPGLQVDLRVVPARSYGAALLYFTGSKAHNIALRNMALDQDLKINEYGVFRQPEDDGEEGEQLAGETEEAIYALFDLPFIAPELRENRGEIEAAQRGELPALITLDDIRGDLQAHTRASDGRATLEEMAQAAQERGYDYFAVTDHSAYIGVTQGLDAEALVEQLAAIEQLNAQMDALRLLKGIEVDVLEDGSLDLPDDVLAKTDVVVAAVHSHFDLSREKQTERIIRALDNPHVNILAHPTGRRIHDRAPYDVDLGRVMEAARERGCFLELNAQPERLDLNDVHCKMAREMGLKLSIATDAHSPDELDVMRFGVYQARRGWLEPDDVLNTRSWDDLKDILQR
jgi:DNA polymerase (family 10)